MAPTARFSEFDLERIRRGIFLVNLGLVSLLALIAYAAFLESGIEVYWLVTLPMVWCIYVQYRVRQKQRDARRRARAHLLQNFAWATLGVSVTLSQLVYPLIAVFSR